MRKIAIFFFFILFFLFLSNNEVWGVVGNPCTCHFDAYDLIDPCKDPTPPSCDPGETCNCVPEIDTFSGAPIGCYPGTCISKPTPIPTPTGAQPGCDPYMTATGCIAINIHCTSGYTPVVSADCLSCWCELIPVAAGGDCIDTAIGEICGLDNPANFVSWFLTFAIGIAGGIAFLLIIFGAFQILTSSGNPEKIQAGKELITSALAGLLLIIFAVFILRLIAAEILKIPGFE